MARRDKAGSLKCGRMLKKKAGSGEYIPLTRHRAKKLVKKCTKSGTRACDPQQQLPHWGSVLARWATVAYGLSALNP